VSRATVFTCAYTLVPLEGNIVSIAFFNFAGISVTRELSATTRMVLDCMRTLVVYVVSLGLHWQGFHYLQVIGACPPLADCATRARYRTQ